MHGGLAVYKVVDLKALETAVSHTVVDTMRAKIIMLPFPRDFTVF